MSKTLRSLIKEIVEEELDEISSSAAAGPFNTPNAFRGNAESGKEKQKKNSEKVGYKLVDKSLEKADDVTSTEKTERHKTFGDGALKEPEKK